jgi:hypothetical protein
MQELQEQAAQQQEQAPLSPQPPAPVQEVAPVVEDEQAQQQQQQAADPQSIRRAKRKRYNANSSGTKYTCRTSANVENLVEACGTKLKLVLRNSRNRSGVADDVASAKEAIAAAKAQLAVMQEALSMVVDPNGNKLDGKLPGEAQEAKTKMQLANREVEQQHAIVHEIWKMFK